MSIFVHNHAPTRWRRRWGVSEWQKQRQEQQGQQQASGAAECSAAREEGASMPRARWGRGRGAGGAGFRTAARDFETPLQVPGGVARVHARVRVQTLVRMRTRTH